MMVTLALCTTGLGVLLPVFRDGGGLGTPFGRLVMAAGTLGELGPIVAMSLLLSTRYSTLAGSGVPCRLSRHRRRWRSPSAWVSAPPKVIALLGRHMHASTQLPVRISFLMLAALFALAKEFGFESIFGAFAAGMIVGQATRGETAGRLREKIEARRVRLVLSVLLRRHRHQVRRRPRWSRISPRCCSCRPSLCCSCSSAACRCCCIDAR